MTGRSPPSDKPWSRLPEAIGFDGLVLEPARGRLLGRDGVEVALRPKAFEVLVTLAAAAGRPLSKAELLDRVWGDVHVTEDSLFQAVKDARRALDDRDGKLLRHVPRRGYMLDCPLSATTATTPPSEPSLSAARPSVAVLPFRVLGDDSAAYVAAGLVEEISIALSRFRWLFVLAHVSAREMDARAARASDEDALAAGRSLDIRYLVDGSFAKDGPRLVVRCRLVETATNRQVWQDRFTAEAGDVLALYEAMTAAIAAAMEPRLLRAEIDRVLRRGTADLDAFDCYLRALPGYYSRTPRGNSEAIGLLEVALERDRHFVLARALLARCVATGLWLGTEPNPAAGAARALGLAREALSEDRTDPQVLALCGHLLALVGGEHAEGGALLDLVAPDEPERRRSMAAGRLGRGLERRDGPRPSAPRRGGAAGPAFGAAGGCPCRPQRGPVLRSPFRRGSRRGAALDRHDARGNVAAALPDRRPVASWRAGGGARGLLRDAGATAQRVPPAITGAQPAPPPVDGRPVHRRPPRSRPARIGMEECPVTSTVGAGALGTNGARTDRNT